MQGCRSPQISWCNRTMLELIDIPWNLTAIVLQIAMGSMKEKLGKTSVHEILMYTWTKLPNNMVTERYLQWNMRIELYLERRAGCGSPVETQHCALFPRTSCPQQPWPERAHHDGRKFNNEPISNELKYSNANFRIMYC